MKTLDGWPDEKYHGGTHDQLERIIREAVPNEVPRPALLDAIDFCEDVEEQSIRWGWKYYLPYKKLTILAARGGAYKTSILIDVAATYTTGGRLPSGEWCEGGKKVLFVTTEDDVDDTLKPRFTKAGGDPKHMMFISSEKLHLDFNEKPEELDIILDGLSKVDLVILDPITSMTGTANTHMDSVVKGICGKISGIIKKHDCQLIGILHFRKGDPTQEKNFVDMVTGSAGWVKSARVAMACFLDEETNTGYFGLIKSNIGPRDLMFNYYPEIENDTIKLTYGEQHREHLAKVIYEKFGKTKDNDAASQKKDDISETALLINKYFLRESEDKFALPEDVKKYVKQFIGRKISDDVYLRAEKETGFNKFKHGKGGKYYLHHFDCKCERCIKASNSHKGVKV